jgi:hypothetical protein
MVEQWSIEFLWISPYSINWEAFTVCQILNLTLAHAKMNKYSLMEIHVYQIWFLDGSLESHFFFVEYNSQCNKLSTMGLKIIVA